MFNIHRFIFNPFGENTYLLVDQDSKDAVVVDPGMFNDQENKVFDKFINDNHINLQQIINTHLHLDHCFGAGHVKNKYGIKLSASVGEAPLGLALGKQALKFGIKGVFSQQGITIDINLSDGDIITVGNSQLTVIAVPGHSPGGIALYCKEQGFVLSGDSLFEGSIGRTDLEGGNHATLVRSVTDRLLTLPPATDVFPGHGASTTIANERRFNPYL